MARNWTPSQTAAMDLRDKLILVSAAAGSGKTSVLTERIIRTLTDREHPADLSRLLVVTFTRAAAAELKARIASALTEALAEQCADKLTPLKMAGHTPLIVEIPDRHGQRNKDAIGKYIREAIGVKL